MENYGLPPKKQWRAFRDSAYIVSDEGGVFSLRTQRSVAQRQRGGKYWCCDLRIDDKKETFYIHRLVLETFTGPCPPGQEGCHDDGDPSNNRLENLRWDTKSANAADTLDMGRHVAAGKLDGLDRTAIWVLYNRLEWSQTRIAEAFDIEQTSVSAALRKANNEQEYETAWSARDREDDSALDVGEEPRT